MTADEIREIEHLRNDVIFMMGLYDRLEKKDKLPDADFAGVLAKRVFEMAEVLKKYHEPG